MFTCHHIIDITMASVVFMLCVLCLLVTLVVGGGKSQKKSMKSNNLDHLKTIAKRDNELCTNACQWRHDTECDDGGLGSAYSLCPLGSDCADCGQRGICTEACQWSEDTECDDGGPGSAYSLCPYGSDCIDCGPRPSICSDDCQFKDDTQCDDGGPNSHYSLCDFGSDCTDCGQRPAPYEEPTYAPPPFLYGIGDDFQIYTRASMDAVWVGPAPLSWGVQAMTILNSGVILGVDLVHNMHIKTDLDSPWSWVPNSCCVVDVTDMADGTIVGIGTDLLLYTRDGVNGVWQGSIANSCCVVSLSRMPNGYIIGVGTDGFLYTRPGIEGVWTNVDGSGWISDVSVADDGTLVAIGGNCGLWSRSSYTAAWEGEIPNSRCVISVAFP